MLYLIREALGFLLRICKIQEPVLISCIRNEASCWNSLGRCMRCSAIDLSFHGDHDALGDAITTAPRSVVNPFVLHAAHRQSGHIDDLCIPTTRTRCDS